MQPLAAIIELAEEMSQRHSLEALLQLMADRTAAILGVRRVSVRLLDPSRRQLLAVARAGEPLHDRPVEFRLGEGLIGWVAEHALPLRTDDAEGDPRFAARPGMSGPMGGFLGVPMRAGSECMGVISAVDPTVRFTEVHEQQLLLVAAICGPQVEIARLSRLSQVDPLTGSLNRRGLDDSFPEVAARQEGVIVPLSVAMLDIDRFKAINDRLGHGAGDVVLRHIAWVVGRMLRAGDAVIRYGGEEFLLVLPEVDRERAAHIAERARAAVEAHPTPIAGALVVVTVSLGVAERRAGEGRDALIARADKALYAAKHAGRNRVALAD